MKDDSMTEQDPPEISQQWDACPEGAIQQMVRRQRSRRTTRRLSRAASATGVVAVLVIAVVVGGRHWFNRPPANPVHGTIPRILAKITCEEVVDRLPEYVNDTLNREDPHVYEAVFIHLQHCKECEHKKRELAAAQSVIRGKQPGISRARPGPAAFYAQAIP